VQSRFQKIQSESELETIKSLYISSFRPNERREYDELKQLLLIDECSINQVVAGNKIAGFCILWYFKDFLFIEHFAIEHKLRGCGIGGSTLLLIWKNFQKPVILEVEPALDELSLRRINFYLRNGFHLLERHYMQPSYGSIKPEIEMKLMSTDANLSFERLDNYIRQIRQKVYGKNS